MHFILHYCIIADIAKYFFEISIFLYVLKCLIKVEVVEKKRPFNKYLVKIHIKYCYFGDGQMTSLNGTHLFTSSREKGKRRALCQCVSK